MPRRLRRVRSAGMKQEPGSSTFQATADHNAGPQELTRSVVRLTDRPLLKRRPPLAVAPCGPDRLPRKESCHGLLPRHTGTRPVAKLAPASSNGQTGAHKMSDL